jgi:cell wall assembly regulator SMI1
VALRVLLMHHDGDGGAGVLGDGFALLSAAQIVEHWRLHVQVAQAVEFEMPDEVDADVAGELDPRVRTRIGSHHWLPFADCNGDVTRYIDFDPTSQGTLGQVIEVDPEGLSWRCLAPSFASYLAGHVARLERGEVRFGSLDAGE